MLAQGVPQRLHRRGANQRCDIGNAHALDQIKRGRTFSSNEGTAQCAEDIGAARAKGAIATRLGGPREFADGISGTYDIRK